jgi:formiminoglutamase
MPRDKSFALTLKKLTQKHKAVQVSLDIDAVQACQAPGCSAPQVLGLQAQEFIRCSELAGANSRVRSFGVYEVSPPLDFDQHTATLAAQSILAFIHGVGERKSRLY